MLELYDGKLSRTVLRGERGCKASDLPGAAMFGAQDRRRARKAKSMNSKKAKISLIFLMALIQSIIGYGCCTSSCLKRTVEWENYTPSDFNDNQEIINSEEFKAFQNKLNIENEEIDSYWQTISPVFVNWIKSYDSLFQGKSYLNVKFRLNSNGKIENLRILNTFIVDTNRIAVFKNSVRNNEFKKYQDSTIAVEFSINVNKDGESIQTNRTGPIYIINRGRSKKEIMKVVNANLKPMKQAFQSELNRNLCAHGKITVRFALREDGTIRKCQVVESSYCDQNFENEIVKLVSNWKFSPMLSTCDLTEIVYPFVFNRE